MNRRKAGRNEIGYLDEMVAGGQQQAYEALQLYRSKVNRCKAKKEYEEALNISRRAAISLLSHKYDTSGFEMAKLVIEMLESSNKRLDVDIRGTINDIDVKFSPSALERLDYLKICVKWVLKSGDRELGDPMLNAQYASVLWEYALNAPTDDKQASTLLGVDLSPSGYRKKSTYYFVIGEAPEKLWAKISGTFPPGNQRNQWITLAVTQFLTVENLRDANTLLTIVDNENKENGIATKDEPLLLFCTQLALCCQRDAAPLYKKLINANIQYLQDCDPVVIASLKGPIASKFFGIVPPPNILTMLEGFFGGM